MISLGEQKKNIIIKTWEKNKENKQIGKEAIKS